MRAYRHVHTVTFDETNLVGNVYFAHYLHWQGHCREHFLAEHAPGVLKSLADGTLALVTLGCDMTYYEECFALDKIEVLMTLSAVNGNRIAMNFDFRRGGVQVARGSQSVACMRRTPTGVAPVALSAELSAALNAFA
ncbi:acyl-CoA thioesterase [Streptosporangium sp. NBC_01755]|uniref:acyl-CoA thioesterase n=1 Tax=unclassified Streptosporangium TaxID=2632669 RepID=UPI002DD98DD3|nr:MULTISPECIES: acyl-CoA thioesterase [unclassified Streptosporangium]WSA26701.1 acyl-CoA thioesterase [Streptosporangium sp. NBC_01810]WSD01875.1 acyl-CoA thioesterase [Streptosporangium sp. NBC_01755]